jgi:hypothetical protein
MKRSLVTLLVCIILSSPIFAQGGFKSLFNGKDLKAWQTPELASAWTVKDGLLVVQSDEAQTGSILWTKKDYEDFIVKADFKFGDGTVDSGIFIRDESQQIQIGESGSLKRDMTGSPYIPGKGYPVEANNVAKIIKMNDWNTIQVQAQDNNYTVWLNGEEVMKYTSDNAAESGPIGIQLHPKRDMSIYYKNIAVKKL